MNRFERAENRKLQIADALKGAGVYVFENNTKGDLQLTKSPIKGGFKINGKTYIPRGPGKQAQFEGDSYFLPMLKTKLSTPRVKNSVTKSCSEKIF